MLSVCLYFKVHQPYRLKRFSAGDVGYTHTYFDVKGVKDAIDMAAEKCYLPANDILFRAIKREEGKFKVSFSISGTFLELLHKYRPDVLDSFKKLIATGCVEILAETFYHSLSFLHSKSEFKRQLEKHTTLVSEIFGLEPAVFRNTELIYNNELAKCIKQLGYKGILCEGVERILQGRSQNQLYAAPDNGDFPLFLRNSTLSDDIAFRFGDSNWSEHPLTAEKFASWIHSIPGSDEVINLFMDYETFGIHKKEESGIFSFLEELPAAVLRNSKTDFSVPSILLKNIYPRDIYNVQQPISWEDRSEDACVWSSDMMQNNTLKKVVTLEKLVMNSENQILVDTWGQLQSADHFYYMKKNGKYPNPFTDASEAAVNYYNILVDFEIALIKNNIKNSMQKSGVQLPAFNLY